MNLKHYFANTDGRGVFASAGADGRVTAALYSTLILATMAALPSSWGVS